jgi:hypothetical protein
MRFANSNSSSVSEIILVIKGRASTSLINFCSSMKSWSSELMLVSSIFDSRYSSSFVLVARPSVAGRFWKNYYEKCVSKKQLFLFKAFRKYVHLMMMEKFGFVKHCLKLCMSHTMVD